MSTTSFSELKKNRSSLHEKIIQKTQELHSGKTAESNRLSDDSRFWFPTVDKAGNGSAVIRFLPPPQGEELPWVRLWTHAFQGPTGLWYIENSLTTLGKKDPVGEINRELWAQGDQATVRARKRKLFYFANILVVKDPANPENEGQVKLFRFGSRIMDKINNALEPVDGLDEPVIVYDLWDGANFRLRIRTKDDYRNYDDSTFMDPSPAAASEKEMQAIWESEYSLVEFVDPKNFKPYDQLKAHLDRVLGISSSNDEEEKPQETTVSPPKAKTSQPRKQKEQAPVEEDVSLDDDDDALKYFNSLTNDD